MARNERARIEQSTAALHVSNLFGKVVPLIGAAERRLPIATAPLQLAEMQEHSRALGVVFRLVSRGVFSFKVKARLRQLVPVHVPESQPGARMNGEQLLIGSGQLTGVLEVPHGIAFGRDD